MRCVTAVVGAQYGSEGKGHVVAEFAKRRMFRAYVRVGGPNAGHTFYYEGRKWVSRSVPVGWIDHTAMLLIGPGAVIDPEVLLEEIAEIEEEGHDIRGRLIIDRRAAVITDAMRELEGGTKGFAHRQIGSTGEGVGVCRIARINRLSLIREGSNTQLDAMEYMRADDCQQLEGLVGDTVKLAAKLIDGAAPICLEGTQGVGLSLVTGDWPYCTSADTGAAQLCADSGIPPGALTETILVARTHPIRVAGTSGPLYEERSWEELGLEPETTTVTKKTRRVGIWDVHQVAQAVELNRPAKVIVTFMDYLYPKLAGVKTGPDREFPLRAAEHWFPARDWIELQEQIIRAKIVAFTTGPKSMVWL